MNRDELIEKARAFLALPRGASYLCDFELIDNFVRPLLAVARREALEEAKGLLRQWYTSGRWTLSELVAGIDALARETDKDKPGAVGNPDASAVSGATAPPPALSDADVLKRHHDPEETHWLIERGQAVGHSPTVWWMGSRYSYDGWRDDWTEDANAALFYPSKQAAEAAADTRWKSWKDKQYTITAHRWLRTIPPAPDVFERAARDIANNLPEEWQDDAHPEVAALFRERFGAIVQLVNEASQGCAIHRDEARREYDRLRGEKVQP